MATYTGTFDFDMTTDAKFQALFGAIDAQIQGLGGWTYVSQTGDGDPSTATHPSTNAYACFRCYSTTVGSTTWYVRIDSGRDGGGCPSFKMQFGTSLNGSGTVGGQASTQIVSQSAGGLPTSGTHPIYLSAATGRLMVAIGSTSSYSTWIGFSLHGNVDNSGALLSGMEQFSWGTASTAGRSQYVPASGTVPAIKSYWTCAYGIEASQAIGGVSLSGHPVLWDSTGANNPTLAACVLASTEFAAGFTTSITMYGVSQTFLIGGSANVLQGASGTTLNIGMRYQ